MDEDDEEESEAEEEDSEDEGKTWEELDEEARLADERKRKRDSDGDEGGSFKRQRF